MRSLAFLIGGIVKIVLPDGRLQGAGQAWVEDFPAVAVKSIGALEVLGAVGLVLPAIVGVMPDLVPWAAVGVLALLLGAALVHARRQEYKQIIVVVMLAVLAGAVAVGRFGPYAF